MKQIALVLAIFGLCLGFMGLPYHQAQASNLSITAWPSTSRSILAVESGRVNKADKKLREIGDKLDLNNSPLRSFRKYRGMFPTIAVMIVENAPYEKVEDVLEIPGLTEKQKELLKANLENFTVTSTSDVFNEGDFRLNTGSYD